MAMVLRNSSLYLHPHCLHSSTGRQPEAAIQSWHQLNNLVSLDKSCSLFFLHQCVTLPSKVPHRHNRLWRLRQHHNFVDLHCTNLQHTLLVHCSLSHCPLDHHRCRQCNHMLQTFAVPFTHHTDLCPCVNHWALSHLRYIIIYRGVCLPLSLSHVLLIARRLRHLRLRQHLRQGSIG